MNSNGGFYLRGKSYGMDTKLLVATKYLEHSGRDRGGGRRGDAFVRLEDRYGRVDGDGADDNGGGRGGRERGSRRRE